jgi:hypothetical protein
MPRPSCKSCRPTVDELVTEMIRVRSWVIAVGFWEDLSYPGVFFGCRSNGDEDLINRFGWLPST